MDEETNGIIFTQTAVDKYIINPRIIDALGGYILLNKSEFLEWMGPEAIRETPPRKVKSKESAESGRAAEKNATEEKYLDLLQSLASEVCLGIQGDYADSQMDNIINDIENFDILVAVSPDYKDIKKGRHIGSITANKINKVVGFIITELGECKKLKDVVSVKLICVKSGTVKGSVLMGAYFGAIKNSSYVKKGILELARGYLNAPGFISYAKMGYKKDISLYGEDCFDDFKNLPMSIDLTDISMEQIINIATGIYQLNEDQVEDNTGIFHLYKGGIKTIPSDLLACNNLLLKAELDDEKLINTMQECDSESGKIEDDEMEDDEMEDDETEPRTCILKPEELKILEVLKREGIPKIDKSNINDFIRRLTSLRDQLVGQLLPRAGSKKKKSSRKKKSTRKKNRRRFTKKSKK